MKNKSKIILFTIVIILFTIVIIMFVLRSWKTSKIPLINLITKSETSGDIKYVSIYSNRKSKKTDAFISDDLEIYNADSRSFSSYISNNTILNAKQNCT